MASYSAAWGLDIGETSVKAVRLNRVGSGVTVTAFAVEPIEHGEDVDREAAVDEALRTLVQRQDMSREPVIVALSGRQVFSKTINLPVINPKTVHRMVELEAQQQIPGGTSEVLWGYHLSPSTQADGSYDVALFAAKEEIVASLIATCQAVGLKLAGVSITSMAVYNFISYDQDFQDSESVIVLDVGAENTDLVVYQGDALWTRNLRVSGNEITRAFMKKFRVTFEEAERLKQEVNQSNQADRIMRVIEGSLGDLVAEIKRSLGFYKSQNPEAQFEDVVVCGNTFRLELLSEYLADRLGYPIIALVELERIEMDAGLDREVFLAELQGMSTAMGLALQGVGLARADINLLPREAQIQQMLDSKRWAPAVILALLLITAVATYAVRSNRLASHAAMIRDIDAFVAQEEESQETAVALLNSLIPLATTLNEFDRVGLQRGVLHTVQSQVLALIDQLATDESFFLPPMVGSVADGGDPVRQPLYLDAIEVEPVSLANSDVFAPTATPRAVAVTIRIPQSVGFRQIHGRVRDGLRALTIGEGLARIYNLPSDTPLFAAVEEGPRVERVDSWRYLDSYRVDARGNLAPLTEARQLRVMVARYDCVVNHLVPRQGEDEGSRP